MSADRLPDDDPDVIEMHTKRLCDEFFVEEVTPPGAPPEKPRRKKAQDIHALRLFVRTIEPCTDREKWAAVRWLMAVYGVKDK